MYKQKLLLLIIIPSVLCSLSWPGIGNFSAPTLSYPLVNFDQVAGKPVFWNNRNTSFEGKIVFVEYDFPLAGVPLEPIIVDYQRHGPAAIVFKDDSNDPGKIWLNSNHKHRHVKVPVVAMKDDDFNALIELFTNETYLQNNITLTHEENKWEQTLGSMLFVLLAQLPFLLWSLTLMSLCVYRLYCMSSSRSNKRCNVTPMLLILMLELLANTERFIFAIDLFGSRRLYPPWMAYVSYRHTIPYSLGSFLIMAVHWNEILKANQVVINRFLSRSNKIIYATVIALILVETIIDIVGSVLTVQLFYLIPLILYFIFTALIAIFYNATAIRVLMRVSKLRVCNDKPAITGAMYKALMVGIILIIILVFTILFLPSIYTYAVNYVIIRSTYTFLWFAASTFQILHFYDTTDWSGRAASSVFGIKVDSSSPRQSRNTMSSVVRSVTDIK